MNSNLITVLVATCFLNFICAAVLPDFITPCKGNDPNFIECSIKEANRVFPILLKGYPKLNIPVLAPLIIPEIKIEKTDQFELTLRNLIINGLENTKILYHKTDFKSQNIACKVLIPLFNAQCEYEINGHILALPLNGKGPANITAVDGVYDYNFSYSLYDKDGIKYAKVEKLDIEFELKGFSIALNNLFNGNKELGDATNKALNKEWRQLLKVLGPVLKAEISTIIMQLANSFFDKISFADMYGGVLP